MTTLNDAIAENVLEKQHQHQHQHHQQQQTQGNAVGYQSAGACIEFAAQSKEKQNRKQKDKNKLANTSRVSSPAMLSQSNTTGAAATSTTATVSSSVSASASASKSSAALPSPASKSCPSPAPEATTTLLPASKATTTTAAAAAAAAGPAAIEHAMAKVSAIPAATQFSVQRSDANGCLRMKISAIRPANLANLGSTDSLVASKTKYKSSSNSNTINNNTVNTNNNNNNNSLQSIKGDTVVPKLETTKTPATGLSDITDSGCSEATNATTTNGHEKATPKRIRVKRKKSQLKANDGKRFMSSLRSHSVKENTYTTDSEDEPLSNKLLPKVHPTQRPPRLLLSVLNSKNSSLNASGETIAPQINSTNPTSHINDHLGLSSSDNELPALVSAAIKRVVGGASDDDDQLCGIVIPKIKSKDLPQYQSSLLQDFMEKTQSLGQTAKSELAERSQPTKGSANSLTESALQPTIHSQTQTALANNNSNNSIKKRRGRPKKPSKQFATNLVSDLIANSSSKSNLLPCPSSHVNESADSGVVSTTSISTQSVSPQPVISSVLATNDINSNSLQKHMKYANETKAALPPAASTTSTSKLKIDIALLDKRMYATERVLYPPPRNKRRQTKDAAPSSSDRTHKLLAGASRLMNSTNNSMGKLNRDDVQLDPAWCEIDVNRKYRRPTVASSGYKSDAGGEEHRVSRSTKSTVCSKILASKSGYLSDYCSAPLRLSKHLRHKNNNSGYKSDASCKSRFSSKSCASHYSRAKSCGYRSDYKDNNGDSKCSKFRRKHRSAVMQKSLGSLKDEQDILQLAGLSLGQSSEESNECVSKPSLEQLPTTSASKKYGEINRYVATGEYFGRGSSPMALMPTFAALNTKILPLFGRNSPAQISQPLMHKLPLLQHENSTTSEFGNDMVMPLPAAPSAHTTHKMKSRRSSIASFCSSFYSSTSKMKRKRHRRTYRCPNSILSKNTVIDSKLLTEIEILTNTFAARCRIQPGGFPAGDKIPVGSNASHKEKLMAEANKLQQSLAAAAAVAAHSTTSRREVRDKRSVKKRKISENLDFAMLSASAAASGLTACYAVNTKRRHKKANSSSPDDHKLPLKKRHYLLTPRDKSNEAAIAVATKLFANNSEAWAAAAAAAKSTASTKSQQQFNAKAGKANLTPKKRHLLQQSNAAAVGEDGPNVKTTNSNSSPLRISVADPNSISGGKLLDISPHSLNSLKQSVECVHRKRCRLEGLVSKIAIHQGADGDCSVPMKETLKQNRTKFSNNVQLDSESSSCPPPGVFEPSVELEIQIPSINKLVEQTVGVITKSEVDSPNLSVDTNKTYASLATKSDASTRVIETLLHKSIASNTQTQVKRKRKKFNRTGFPTVRRKKRKVSDSKSVKNVFSDTNEANTDAAVDSTETTTCDRVPQPGETSSTFLERNNNHTPRLSVVALERLQETPSLNVSKEKTHKTINQVDQRTTPTTTGKERVSRLLLKSKRSKEDSKASLSLDQQKQTVSSKTAVTAHSKDKQDITSSQVNKNKTAVSSVKSLRKPSAGKSRRTPIDSVILPVGVDPNTNFSCKIRLKRRNSLHLPAPYHAMMSNGTADVVSTPEELEAEAAAKNCNDNYLEHEILPCTSKQIACPNDTEASYTSDEKASTYSSAAAKRTRLIKKNYLPAGLFSDYYKVIHIKKSSTSRKESERRDTNSNTHTEGKEPSELETPAVQLPPPPYCENYLRRTQIDFQLPYDIWWAYTNCKLPTHINVPSWNYRKIRTNIYAESVRPHNIPSGDHPMCTCKPEVGCGDECLNRIVYTECSPANCPTKEKCRNQKIQRHEVATGIVRFMTTDKGWGVRTKLPIAKGTYILEYVGEVVTEREFKDRMATIYLNDNHHYCLHLDGGLVIDGHRMGSDCRFVNHSCQPNCEMQKWSVNGLSRMALFAKRNIEEGEELTYDYNFSLFNPSEGQTCRCNTPQCRGVIGGKSQRIKPLPIAEPKFAADSVPIETRKYHQRKHKASKNTTQRQTSKETNDIATMQPLTDRERRLIKQQAIFLLRNLEKIRRFKCKFQQSKSSQADGQQQAGAGKLVRATDMRRSPTPVSLATQISALCSVRNIKTRGLTIAERDPEVEKMAKMAKVFRDICATLMTMKHPDDERQTLFSAVLAETPGAAAAPSTVNRRKKLGVKTNTRPQNDFDMKAIQGNIEKGLYKTPDDFDHDMRKLFEDVKRSLAASEDNTAKLKALDCLVQAYEMEKHRQYCVLLQLLNDEQMLAAFRKADEKSTTAAATAVTEASAETSVTAEATGEGNAEASVEATDGKAEIATEAAAQSEAPATSTAAEPVKEASLTEATAVQTQDDDPSARQVDVPDNLPKTNAFNETVVNADSNEDIIRCICGLYKDEGLMIQCSTCFVWQHTECTKADTDAESYLCEKCDPRPIDYEISLDEFTEEGHRYYLTLMRGKDLQVRQGDAVYVLRDIPIKNADDDCTPSGKKHTYETIGHIDYNECDIFRVERLWKDEAGKRFIFGHHFLRPHETFHEPSRKFYPNEVVRVPLYEVVPIELVIARCWVLDRTTFCKGRPIECTDDAHCFICELRVDKQARFFSKAKMNYPTCTKSYAFRKFVEKLRISKTYAPHEVDPALFKTRKHKNEAAAVAADRNAASVASNQVPSSALKRETASGNETNASSSLTTQHTKLVHYGGRKNLTNSSGSASHLLEATANQSETMSFQTKRDRLDKVISAIRNISEMDANQPPLDLSYLLKGRGSRHRKNPTVAQSTKI